MPTEILGKNLAAKPVAIRKSGRPHTPADTTDSPQHGIPSGRLTEAVVLSTESSFAFQTFESEYRDVCRPEGPAQTFLVDQMIAASWRLYRLWHAERAMIDHEVDRSQSASQPPTEELELPTRTSLAVRTLSNVGRPLEAWNRYEARLERQFRYALNKLLALQRRQKKIAGRSHHQAATPMIATAHRGFGGFAPHPQSHL